VLDTFYGFYTPGSRSLKVVGGIADDVIKGLREFSAGLASQVGSILKDTLLLVVNLLITLVSLFFFFRDGERWYASVTELLPFTHEQQHAIAKKFRDTFSAVINGVFLMPLTYIFSFAVFAGFYDLNGAAIARFAQLVILSGIAGTAWNALFNVVPSQKRGQVLAFNNGVPSQIGVVLSGVLLIVAERAFMHRSRLLAERDHAVRARGNAVLAPDADVLLHEHVVHVGPDNSLHRAGVQAPRVLAVFARIAREEPAPLNAVLAELLEETDMTPVRCGEIPCVVIGITREVVRDLTEAGDGLTVDMAIQLQGVDAGAGQLRTNDGVIAFRGLVQVERAADPMQFRVVVGLDLKFLGDRPLVKIDLGIVVIHAGEIIVRE